MTMASGLLPVKQKGSGIMKCKHCKTKNITKAHYCKHCGSPFIQEERDKAYNRTIFGILTNIRKLKSYATLSLITAKPWFKALTLVSILLYGLLQIKINGSYMKIQPSEYYDVQYNKVAKEYYITSQHRQIGLNLYLPKEAEDISVIEMDLDNNPKGSYIYEQNDNIVVNYKINSKYRIQTNFVDNKCQTIDFYFIINTKAE